VAEIFVTDTEPSENDDENREWQSSKDVKPGNVLQNGPSK
jgi:hypothetical protein